MTAPDTIPDGVREAAGSDAVAAAAVTLFGGKVALRPDLLDLVQRVLGAADAVRAVAVFPEGWFVAPGAGGELVVMRDMPGTDPRFVISESLAGWLLWPLLEASLPRRASAGAPPSGGAETAVLPVVPATAPLRVPGPGGRS